MMLNMCKVGVNADATIGVVHENEENRPIYIISDVQQEGDDLILLSPTSRNSIIQSELGILFLKKHVRHDLYIDCVDCCMNAYHGA